MVKANVGDPSLQQIFKITSADRPSLFLVDPQGKILERIQDRSAAGIAAKLKEAAERINPPPKKEEPVKISWASSVDAARETARKEKLAVAIVVTAPGDSTAKLLTNLENSQLKETLPRFIFVKLAYDKESETVKALKLKEEPALIVLDPHEGMLEERVLARKPGAPSASQIGQFLKPFLTPKFACAECDRPGFVAGSCHEKPMEKVKPESKGN